jgi:hypothetical protein
VKKFEPSGEVIGARQFETSTAGRQIDNVTFNRRRLRAKKDFPDPGDQTPWGHAKPASFVRPVHLSAELESLHLYVPLITDPLRRGAYYLTEIMEHSPPIEYHLLVWPCSRIKPVELTDPLNGRGNALSVSRISSFVMPGTSTDSSKTIFRFGKRPRWSGEKNDRP